MRDLVATIAATDQDGILHQVRSYGGESLMRLLKDAGLPIHAVCGGGTSCGTCHIYVEDRWAALLPPPSSAEQQMLEALDSFDPDRSRLACQIEIGPELDGLSLTLGPQE
jgi:2Fe-2S ferredoxin